MTDEQKIELLADLFEVDASEIIPDKPLSALKWDSMNMLSLIALFKSEFDKKLPASTIRAFVTIGDILKEMES